MPRALETFAPPLYTITINYYRLWQTAKSIGYSKGYIPLHELVAIFCCWKHATFEARVYGPWSRAVATGVKKQQNKTKQFIWFYFISFYFISFYFISFHVIYYIILYYIILFYFILFYCMSGLLCNKCRNILILVYCTWNHTKSICFVLHIKLPSCDVWNIFHMQVPLFDHKATDSGLYSWVPQRSVQL